MVSEEFTSTYIFFSHQCYLPQKPNSETLSKAPVKDPITLIHAPGLDIQYENSAKSSYLSSTLNSEIRILSTCREQIEPWWKGQIHLNAYVFLFFLSHQCGVLRHKLVRIIRKVQASPRFNPTLNNSFPPSHSDHHDHASSHSC